jgi:hypothetical protein
MRMINLTSQPPLLLLLLLRFFAKVDSLWQFQKRKEKPWACNSSCCIVANELANNDTDDDEDSDGKFPC